VGSEVQILPGPPPSTPLGVDRNARLSRMPAWHATNAVYRAFVLSGVSLAYFVFLTYVVHRLRWGCSSAGRAPALQAGGHRFEPVHLHQILLDLVQNLTLPRFCLGFLPSFLCFPCLSCLVPLRAFVLRPDGSKNIVAEKLSHSMPGFPVTPNGGRAIRHR
jgi:hypothetical protein